jgi:hypothetical protein
LERCSEAGELVFLTISSLVDLQERRLARGQPALIDEIVMEVLNIGEDGGVVVNWDLSWAAASLELAPTTNTLTALVSSFPYPHNLVDWIAEAVKKPDAFAADLIAFSRSFPLFRSFQLDWEPTEGVTPQLAEGYARLIGTTARTLGREGISLSVTVASWCALVSNFSAIAASSADVRLADMSTYATNVTTFATALDAALLAIPEEQLVVGMMNREGNNGQPLSDAVINGHFAVLARQPRVHALALWRAPVHNPTWWTRLSEWKEKQVQVQQVQQLSRKRQQEVGGGLRDPTSPPPPPPPPPSSPSRSHLPTLALIAFIVTPLLTLALGCVCCCRMIRSSASPARRPAGSGRYSALDTVLEEEEEEEREREAGGQVHDGESTSSDGYGEEDGEADGYDYDYGDSRLHIEPAAPGESVILQAAGPGRDRASSAGRSLGRIVNVDSDSEESVQQRDYLEETETTARIFQEREGGPAPV